MLKNKVESLLFVATRPLSLKKIINITKQPAEEVKKSLVELTTDYQQRGICLLKNGQSYQLATSPVNAKFVQDFLKEEMTGELTRPSLETLTIVAYRGPISKIALEEIRGVNCSLILRNLSIRGLIKSQEAKKDSPPIYQITFEFMRYLGIKDIKELPDYDKLHSDENLAKTIDGDAEERSIDYHKNTENTHLRPSGFGGQAKIQKTQ